MKIAFTSSGKDLDSILDLRFGRCPYFLIYDTENKEIKALENQGQSSGGGAGITAAQQIIDENVEVVITSNMGPNAFDLMESSGIKVYKGRSISCRLLIDELNDGKLNELDSIGPSHAGMGK